MRLLDLIIKEYFAIIERLIGKVEIVDNRIALDSKSFYSFLDKNLYIKRNDKLKIYRQLNMIRCNSNGFTSVMYDKETKKTRRKIILDVSTYKILKALYDTKFEN